MSARYATIKTPRESDYTLELSASGLTLNITEEATGKTYPIAVRAWDGIVAAAKVLQVAAEEQARRNVIVDELLYGEP